MRWPKVLEGLALLPALVSSLASTDSIQDADPAQSGYLPNHKMNPNGKFVSSWIKTYNTNEVFYAKPLVYTPSGSASELVITASNQNIVRVIDGLTGALLTQRTLDPPFSQVDTGNCPDIPNTIGITGTPIIDPATDTIYLYSKGYKGAAVGPAGTINGQYKFYALNVRTLQDVPGFPVIVDGHAANNDPTRYFLGGNVLQRPSLASVGSVVVAGFAGHCDKFNYTGMLVAVSKTSGVGVTNVIAMEAQPGAPSPQALDINVEGGGKSGIWQSGMGIAVDGSRIFFATGNGRGGGDNGGGIPASGKKAISTLEQVVANFGVNPSTGVLTQQDYFEPFEYNSLNGGDKDFGSSGVALLDPAVFSGGGISRMAMAGGKSGKVYLMNADDLGGFANGPGKTDNVIQTILNSNSLFSGIGSYPLEGGYIYYVPTGDVLYAYKMGLDGSGRPLLTLAGTSVAKFAGKGVPTVTSFNGQAGTGIVWVADVNLGLVAYKAVPVNGVLVPITFPASGRLTKFHRPVFGNARVYVTENNQIIAFDGSGNLPSSSSTSTTASSTSTSTSTTSSTTSTTTSTTSTTTSTTSTTRSTTSTTTTTTTTSSGPASTSATTTTSTSVSTTFSTSTTSANPSATSAYPYIGCFQDKLTGGHALPLLFANNSVTPELCIAYAQSLAHKAVPTVLPYVFVEYHRECYGGSSFAFGTSGVTSLTGAHACTDVCSGSIGAATTGTAMCGGPHQFNLYATSSSVSFPAPVTTRSV